MIGEHIFELEIDRHTLSKLIVCWEKVQNWSLLQQTISDGNFYKYEDKKIL